MTRERVLHITLADCDVQTFRAGGPGGQNQNKRDTGVRIKHRASGAVGESRSHRTQLENKRVAWKRMSEQPEFTRWLRLEHARRIGRIDEQVEAAMQPQNLIIEFGPFDEKVE